MKEAQELMENSVQAYEVEVDQEGFVFKFSGSLQHSNSFLVGSSSLNSLQKVAHLSYKKYKHEKSKFLRLKIL